MGYKFSLEKWKQEARNAWKEEMQPLADKVKRGKGVLLSDVIAVEMAKGAVHAFYDAFAPFDGREVTPTDEERGVVRPEGLDVELEVCDSADDEEDLVFSTSKYIEAEGEEAYKLLTEYVDCCDGQRVKRSSVPGSDYFFCEGTGFTVHRDWLVPVSEYKPFHKKEDLVFSISKYIEAEGMNEYLRHAKWVDKCDGMRAVPNDVSGSSTYPSECGTYFFHRDWLVPASEYKPYRKDEEELVFSALKFTEEEGEEAYKICADWVDAFDGKRAKPVGDAFTCEDVGGLVCRSWLVPASEYKPYRKDEEELVFRGALWMKNRCEEDGDIPSNLEWVKRCEGCKVHPAGVPNQPNLYTNDEGYLFDRSWLEPVTKS